MDDEEANNKTEGAEKGTAGSAVDEKVGNEWRRGREFKAGGLRSDVPRAKGYRVNYDHIGLKKFTRNCKGPSVSCPS
jgi:hypothetical protein